MLIFLFANLSQIWNTKFRSQSSFIWELNPYFRYLERWCIKWWTYTIVLFKKMLDEGEESKPLVSLAEKNIVFKKDSESY